MKYTVVASYTDEHPNFPKAPMQRLLCVLDNGKAAQICTIGGREVAYGEYESFIEARNSLLATIQEARRKNCKITRNELPKEGLAGER